MYVVSQHTQKTSTKPSIYEILMSIWMSISHELLNINLQQYINPIHRALTLTTTNEKLDEFGFVVVPPEIKLERRKWLSRMRYLKGGSTVGSKSCCKGLCLHLPYRGKGSGVSFKKTGQYWCKECERAIPCNRCRCCGNLGRKEPRTRNRDNCKRIE